MPASCGGRRLARVEAARRRPGPRTCRRGSAGRGRRARGGASTCPSPTGRARRRARRRRSRARRRRAPACAVGVREAQVVDDRYSHSAPTTISATAAASAARSRCRHGGRGACVRPPAAVAARLHRLGQVEAPLERARRAAARAGAHRVRAATPRPRSASCMIARVALERRHEPGRERDREGSSGAPSRPRRAGGRGRRAGRSRRTRGRRPRAAAPGRARRGAPRWSRRAGRAPGSSGPTHSSCEPIVSTNGVRTKTKSALVSVPIRYGQRRFGGGAQRDEQQDQADHRDRRGVRGESAVTTTCCEER